MISQELEAVLHKCFVEARSALHRRVTLDHLLLAAIESEQARQFLVSENIEIESFRTQLQERVASTPHAGDSEDLQIEPTRDFQRTIQHTIERVRSEGRAEVTTLDVLKSVLHPPPRMPWLRFWRGAA